jgi:hypothetical protein
MLKNLGTVDRGIRLFIVIVFAVLIIMGLVKGAGLIICSVIGAYLLFTSLFSFCFFYSIVGIHTLRTKSGVDD